MQETIMAIIHAIPTWKHTSNSNIDRHATIDMNAITCNSNHGCNTSMNHNSTCKQYAYESSKLHATCKSTLSCKPSKQTTTNMHEQRKHP